MPKAKVSEELCELVKPFLEEGECAHILISSRNGRHEKKGIKAHVHERELPEGSLLTVTIDGQELRVCSPELVFMQMAERADLARLTSIGCALCSNYRLDPGAKGGVVTRSQQAGDAPLTTRAALEAYAKKLPPRSRCRAKALEALKYVCDGARSPMESGVALALTLPVKAHGLQLGRAELNKSVKVVKQVSADGSRICVPRLIDVTIEGLALRVRNAAEVLLGGVVSGARGAAGARVAAGARGTAAGMTDEKDAGEKNPVVGIEYDSDAHHLSSRGVARDAERRNLVMASGAMPLFTLTTAMTSEYNAFCRAVDSITTALGQPIRNKPGLGFHELWMRLLSAARMAW